jgi:hypothetical protein
MVNLQALNDLDSQETVQHSNSPIVGSRIKNFAQQKVIFSSASSNLSSADCGELESN